MIKNYLWTLPFISFLCGYQLLNYTTHIKEVHAPSLVGLTITQAIKILSDHNLNPRILVEKEEKDVLPGTILSQTPSAGQTIKINQPVFLVIAQKPRPLSSPDLRGKSEQDVASILNSSNIRAKKHYISSKYPQGTCLGQLPVPKVPLENRSMIIYISAGNNKLTLFPNLKNCLVRDVKDFFQGYSITFKLFHSQPTPDDHQCDSCVIVDHKPLPGSLVDINKSLHVQLQLE